ncbi:MAG TPA: ComEA family DNA-binding protein [Nocardioidaceae bacterium]|nr:ComEA family DNA-binding protein [Nocardioidaceae bacterium]
MRSRRSAQDELAAISRRRLELLSAELAGVRPMAADGGSEPDAGPGDDPPINKPGHPPGRHARRPVRASGRAAGWLRDRLPPTLQGHVRLTPGHLTVVAVLVAAALAVTSWWVVQAEGTTTVLPAATWSEAAEPSEDEPALVTPAAQASADATVEAAVVVVDVAGKVRRPGIATLPAGSRVVDALEAAGGVRPGVELTTLNLARVLVDGEQIVVGIPPPGGVAASAASAPGAAAGAGPLVNINTAGQAELEELPGVGPVTAAAILQWRTDHGPFTSVDELMEVSGIGEATLAEMAPFVTL